MSDTDQVTSGDKVRSGRSTQVRVRSEKGDVKVRSSQGQIMSCQSGHGQDMSGLDRSEKFSLTQDKLKSD